MSEKKTFKDVVREILYKLREGCTYGEDEYGQDCSREYNEDTNQALSALLKEVDKRIGEDKDASSYHRKEYRDMIQIQYCEGYNEAKAEVRKAMGL